MFASAVVDKLNGKVCCPLQNCRRCARLNLSLGLDKLLMPPVTHDQRDARPTVTFPAIGHHCPLTSTRELHGDGDHGFTAVTAVTPR